MSRANFRFSRLSAFISLIRDKIKRHDFLIERAIRKTNKKPECAYEGKFQAPHFFNFFIFAGRFFFLFFFCKTCFPSRRSYFFLPSSVAPHSSRHHTPQKNEKTLFLRHLIFPLCSSGVPYILSTPHNIT